MSKISQAVEKEDLVDYADLFASYSKKRQKEILYVKKTNHLNKENLKKITFNVNYVDTSSFLSIQSPPLK